MGQTAIFVSATVRDHPRAASIASAMPPAIEFELD